MQQISKLHDTCCWLDYTLNILITKPSPRTILKPERKEPVKKPKKTRKEQKDGDEDEGSEPDKTPRVNKSKGDTKAKAKAKAKQRKWSYNFCFIASVTGPCFPNVVLEHPGMWLD